MNSRRHTIGPCFLAVFSLKSIFCTQSKNAARFRIKQILPYFTYLDLTAIIHILLLPYVIDPDENSTCSGQLHKHACTYAQTIGIRKLRHLYRTSSVPFCHTDPTRKLLSSNQSLTSSTTPMRRALLRKYYSCRWAVDRFELWEQSEAWCLKNLYLNLTLWEDLKENRSNIFGGMRLVQKRKHEKRNTSEVDDGKGGETLSSIPARDPLLNLREWLRF